MHSCFSFPSVFRDCSLVTTVSGIMGCSFCSTSGVFCGLCDMNVGQMIEAAIVVDQGEYKILNSHCRRHVISIFFRPVHLVSIPYLQEHNS